MRGVIGNVRERQNNYIDMMLSQEGGVSQYRVRAANTLDHAYGPTNGVGGTGATALFTAAAGTGFRSHTIQKNKRHVVHGAGRDRGITRMIFDPDDFFDPVGSPLVPSDSQIMFMRIEKFSDALDAFEDEGPINIILPKDYMQGMRPVLTLFGTAPGIGSSAGEFPQEGAMHFHLPTFSSSIWIKNLGGADENLHVSFHPGMPMIQLGPGEEIGLYDVNAMEVLISSNRDGAGGDSCPTFNMVFGLQNGP